MNCTNKYKKQYNKGTFGSWRTIPSERRLLSSILVDLEPGMEAFDNELFGPVASVIQQDDAHAVELASNNSVFGLGSGYLLKYEHWRKLALQLEAGSSFVNKLVVSDPRLPLEESKIAVEELTAYGIR
jgi:succinate-semialdehyde dehydrogenase/glutarate-semialdehyde dehydrogenase